MREKSHRPWGNTSTWGRFVSLNVCWNQRPALVSEKVFVSFVFLRIEGVGGHLGNFSKGSDWPSINLPVVKTKSHFQCS